MLQTVTEPAPAKINLTLHVTGRRDDGYHLLDSLVAFASVGDVISVTPADSLRLLIDGPEANGLAADGSNLVLRAARLFDPDCRVEIRLTKNLPVASGIGGGSADAAATLRALARLTGKPVPPSLSLGADMPVCLASAPRRMQGIGEILSPVPALPRLDVLLVNPRISVSTPAVFKALHCAANPGMPDKLPSWQDAASLCDWLRLQRNDLHPAAAALAPEINAILHSLARTNCLVAGMSGSGATCYALFPPDGHSAASAQAQILADHPGYWAAAGTILDKNGLTAPA